MALSGLTGYPATIWSTVLALVAYLQAQVTVDNPSAAQTLLQTGIVTLINARDSISASLTASNLARAYESLSGVTELSLGLSDLDTSFLTARLAALQGAEIACAPLPQVPLPVATTVPFGNPAVVAPRYVEFLVGFSYETPPAGLTAAGFTAAAQAAATAWSDAYAALIASGRSFTTDVLDQTAAMRDASQIVAQEVANITLSPAADLTESWNRLVTLPSIARAIAPLINDPTSVTAQQLMVARYIVLQAISQLTLAVTNLRSTPPEQVRLVVVRRGDTLMRIAARELGDFERFQELAVLNSLVPPYIADQPSAGIAGPGQQIYVPTTTTTATQAVQTSNYRAPSYERSYLGVDFYYGPLDLDMAPWTGDLRTIAGYDNLGFSLGRRIKTPIGAMIWHSAFGSRIPAEIGQIMTLSQATSSYLGAYAASAIQSDPRVQSISNLTVSVIPQDYAFSITADVTPNGAQSAATSVDEVFANSGA